MATGKSNNVDRELEIKNADEAYLEFVKTGQTTHRCLRCGGKLRIDDGKSGYRVWCEQEQRPIITVRGI